MLSQDQVMPYKLVCDSLRWPHRDGHIWPHLRLAGAVVTV